MPRSSFFRFLLFFGMLLAAAGCGQKGPLYFSDSPPPGYKPPRADTYKPVPYPKETERDDAAEK